MSTAWDYPQLTKYSTAATNQQLRVKGGREQHINKGKVPVQREAESFKSPNTTFRLEDYSSKSSFCYFFSLYHNALGLAFTLLKEHEYIIIHTKEQVIVYELPAFPATKAIFIRKLNFILAPIWLPAEEKKPYA